jgi:hypothetical protein
MKIMSALNILKSLLAIAIGGSVVAGTMGSAKAVTVVGGLTFQDNAFADSLISSSGSFTTSGGTLTSVLTDTDSGTYAFSSSPGAFVNLGFTDNLLVNGSGNDLALFELGIPDTFKVTIGGITKSYLSVDTGQSAGGFGLNVATVNLDDFGIAPNTTLSNILIGLDTTSAASTVPSLSLVGALNSGAVTSTAVPEPFTIIGTLIGGTAAFRMRKKLKASAD